MTKKLISLMIVCAMLVPFSPAVAADDSSVPPTIEEILNEYHEKAFAAQTEEDNGNASTWSRSGSGSSQTLEQETVDELTAAGYEAYNVTAENYDFIAQSLNTNLAELGLDPNSSYIVTVGGTNPNEIPSSDSNPNSRVFQPPLQEDFDGDGSSTFTYNYLGITYTMRYIRVTSSTAAELKKNSLYILSDFFPDPTASERLSSQIFTAVTEEAYQVSIADVFDLVFGGQNNSNYTELYADELTLFAYTAWTRQYIQIQDPETGLWHTSQCSSHAVSKAKCAGFVYSELFNEPMWFDGRESSASFYSPKYGETTQRMIDAISAFTIRQTAYDPTGDIHFYFLDGDNVTITQGMEPLFTHFEWDGDLFLPNQ